MRPDSILLIFQIVIFAVITNPVNAQFSFYSPGPDIEKWNVTEIKGRFGLSKPSFGPFTTTEVLKLDTPVLKKKERDAIITFGNLNPIVTVQKQKFYQLQIVSGTDTANVLFSVLSNTKSEKPSFWKKIRGKDEPEDYRTISDTQEVKGIVKTAIDSMVWEFYISTHNNSAAPGYLKTNYDFLHIVPFEDHSNYKSWYHVSSTGNVQKSFVFINKEQNHLAVVQQPPTPWPARKKNSVLMQKDLAQNYRLALAAVCAVILSIKNL